MALEKFDGSIDLKDEKDDVVVKISFEFDDSLSVEQQLGFVGTLGAIVQRELNPEDV